VETSACNKVLNRALDLDRLFGTIHLAQDGNQWWAVINMVMNLGVMKVAVFWVVALYSLAEVCKHFKCSSSILGPLQLIVFLFVCNFINTVETQLSN
jgi:hypothetical protein